MVIIQISFSHARAHVHAKRIQIATIKVAHPGSSLGSANPLCASYHCIKPPSIMLSCQHIGLLSVRVYYYRMI